MNCIINCGNSVLYSRPLCSPLPWEASLETEAGRVVLVPSYCIESLGSTQHLQGGASRCLVFLSSFELCFSFIFPHLWHSCILFLIYIPLLLLSCNYKDGFIRLDPLSWKHGHLLAPAEGEEFCQCARQGPPPIDVRCSSNLVQSMKSWQKDATQSVGRRVSFLFPSFIRQFWVSTIVPMLEPCQEAKQLVIHF